MIEKLIKLADKFDREGKPELANAVDKLFLTAAGRPKSPLKKMDDKVKKNLLKFLHNAEKGMSDAAEGVEELNRRLRYFDLSGHAKDMGLGKVLKDIEKMETTLSDAKNKFYELTHGKKPSKGELDAMFSDDGAEQNADGPLEFFESQYDISDEEFNESQGIHGQENDGEALEGFDEREQEMKEEGPAEMLERSLESASELGPEELAELREFLGFDDEPIDEEPQDLE